MFQIEKFTESKLASITNRAEKHGDEEVPAVSLGFEIEAANNILDSIDPALRHALYVAVEAQEEIPGIEPSTPVLRCNSIDRVALTTKHEGWTLTVDDGIDDTQALAFGGCKIDKLSVEPRQGGKVVLRLRVGTRDISALKLGKIGMHIGQSVWIMVRPPAAPADVIDGTVAAFEADHPDAGDLFAQQHGGDHFPDGVRMEDGSAGPSDPVWPEPAPVDLPVAEGAHKARSMRKAAAAAAEALA